MTRQVITTTPANSNQGDPLKTSFDKVNANFAELYATLVAASSFGVDSGSVNAYVFTHSGPQAVTLAVGTLIRFVPLNTNNGAATLNADGTGAVAILRANGSVLTGGELSSLGSVVLQSTGAQWQIVATAGAQPGFEYTAAESAAGVAVGAIDFRYLPLGSAGADSRRYKTDPTGGSASDAGIANMVAVAAQIAIAAGTPFSFKMAPTGLYKHNNQIPLRSDANVGIDIFGSYMLYTGPQILAQDASGAQVRFTGADHSFGGCYSSIPSGFLDANNLASYNIHSMGNHNFGFCHSYLHFKNALLDGIYAGSVSGNITAITIAANAVITINANTTTNPFAQANITAAIFVNGVSGMTQINGLNGLIVSTGGVQGAWTITTNINSSAFSAFTSGGLISGGQGCVSINWHHLDSYRAGNFGTSNAVAVCGGYAWNFDFNFNVGEIILRDCGSDNGVQGSVVIQGRQPFASFDVTLSTCRWEHWFAGAVFTGTCSGTTLTVTGTVAPNNGIAIGSPLAPAYIEGPGFTPGTGIIGQLSGTTGGGGGATYQLNISQTVATSTTIRQPSPAVTTNYAVVGSQGTLTLKNCKLADSSASGAQAMDLVHNRSTANGRAVVIFDVPLTGSPIQYLYRDEQSHSFDFAYDPKLVLGSRFIATPGASQNYVERIPIGTALNGPAIANISAITAANPAVVTVNSAAVNNPFQVGQQVQILGLTTGMLQINNQVTAVASVGGSAGAWTFTTGINAAAYTAYTSGGTVNFTPVPGMWVWDPATHVARLWDTAQGNMITAKLGQLVWLGQTANVTATYPTDSNTGYHNILAGGNLTYTLPFATGLPDGWESATLQTASAHSWIVTAPDSASICGRAGGVNITSTPVAGNTIKLRWNKGAAVWWPVEYKGSWNTQGDLISLTATAIEQRTTTTTLTNSTQLTYPIASAGTYEFELMVYSYFTTAAADGITANVNYSGSFTAVGSYLQGYLMNGTTTTTGIQPVEVSATVNNALAGLTIAAYGASVSSATPAVHYIKGTLIATGAGTLAFAFAQSTSGADTANLGVGSYMTITQLSN